MKTLLKLLTIFAFSLAIIKAYAAGPDLAPSGTFTIEVKALSMYSGDTGLPTSKGVLTFQGKEYPFTIQALSMGNSFGSSTLKASGVLYGMKDLSQFENPFFIIGGGINPDMRDQYATYKNTKGVIAVMQGDLNGPLWIPSTGAVIKLIK